MQRSKKGIARIEGEAFLQIGKEYTYRLTEWYDNIRTAPENDIKLGIRTYIRSIH